MFNPSFFYMLLVMLSCKTIGTTPDNGSVWLYRMESFFGTPTKGIDNGSVWLYGMGSFLGTPTKGIRVVGDCLTAKPCTSLAPLICGEHQTTAVFGFIR